MLTEGGKLALIASVLMMVSVYHMLSLDLPAWVIKTINKICRRFFWRGADELKGGHCKVAWTQVCKPKSLGGLGLHNLRILNNALRIRWRWLEKVGPLRAWSGLKFKLSQDAEEIFRAATECAVGDGKLTRFWTDRWINGQSAEDLAPDLVPFIVPRSALDMPVDQALQHNTWITCIQGVLTY